MLKRAALGASPANATGINKPASKTPVWMAVRLRFHSNRQSEAASAAQACLTASRTIAGEVDAAELAQQLRELEHVHDLLAGPRPVTVQGHRQREFVEPRGLPAPGRADAEEQEDARHARDQQDETDRRAESEPPVEEHQHGRRRDQADRRVRRELQGQLEVQASAQSRELIPQSALLSRGAIRASANPGLSPRLGSRLGNGSGNIAQRLSRSHPG